MREVIKVIRGNEVSPGIWEYTVPSLTLSGRSRQPLLDACRQIQRTGADPRTPAIIYREGVEHPDMSTTVGYGANLTVSETDKGIRFVKFKEFPGIPA
jgi:hypothetical protein